MVSVRDLDVRRVVLSLPPGHVNALQDLSTYTPTRPSYSSSSSSSSPFSRLLFHPQPFSLSLKLAPTKTAPPPEGFHGRRLKSGSLPCPRRATPRQPGLPRFLFSHLLRRLRIRGWYRDFLRRNAQESGFQNVRLPSVHVRENATKGWSQLVILKIPSDRNDLRKSGQRRSTCNLGRELPVMLREHWEIVRGN